MDVERVSCDEGDVLYTILFRFSLNKLSECDRYHAAQLVTEPFEVFFFVALKKHYSKKRRLERERLVCEERLEPFVIFYELF